MTDTFSTDQVQQGTTDTTTTTTDNTSALEFDSGNKLQQQIDVMQKRIGDKDTHITTIQDENQTLREKLADIDERIEKMGTVEDALARMKENTNSNQDTNLDEATLKSVMKGVIAETTAEDKAEANFTAVSNTLTKMYGKDKVDETVRRIAEENGLTFDDMISLSRKSPNAVYRMSGIKKDSISIAPSQSTNNGYNEGTQTKEQKLAYFAKLRKDDKAAYYRPDVQKAFREACLSN